MQLTTTYTPQQNSVAKRKNRIILNMVQSWLNKGEVPKELWQKTIVWSVHILNRKPYFLC